MPEKTIAPAITAKDKINIQVRRTGACSPSCFFTPSLQRCGNALIRADRLPPLD